MYGNFAPALTEGLKIKIFFLFKNNFAYLKFLGVFLQIGHEFDPAKLEKVHIHPGTYTNVGLETTQYRLIERPRANGTGQECLDIDKSKRNF